jgi:hypothetical protein
MHVAKSAWGLFAVLVLAMPSTSPSTHAHGARSRGLLSHSR